jgi:hypothetical protein
MLRVHATLGMTPLAPGWLLWQGDAVVLWHGERRSRRQVNPPWRWRRSDTASSSAARKS